MLHIESLIDALAPRSAAEQLAARPQLPQRLLRRSRDRNPALRSLRARLDALHGRLDPAELPAGWCAEPELYAPLVSLGDRCPNEHAAVRLLDRLDVVLGRVPVRTPHLDDGWYRLAHLGRGTVRRQGCRVTRVDAHRERAGEPRVLLPVPGLFSDLPFPEVYAGSDRVGDAGVALARYDRARALLAGVDPIVGADFDRTVTTVALLPPVPAPSGEVLPQSHWSFNLRLRYLGAIFVNPFSVGVPALAEGLLHEYLHQRMWLWWELCPPTGLPPWGPAVRSPLSGRMRPLITMIQALVIFRCVRSLHEGLLAGNELGPTERAWCRERVQRLAVGVPELARELASRLPPRSEARGLVELVRGEGATLACDAA